MELKAITKEQSGSYECIASNDISNPDVRTVEVTVNCKGRRKEKKKITLSGSKLDIMIESHPEKFLLRLTKRLNFTLFLYVCGMSLEN